MLAQTKLPPVRGNVFSDVSQSFGILLEEMIILVKCVCVSITGHRQNNGFQTLYSAANSFSYCVKVVKQVVFCCFFISCQNMC